MKKNNVSVYIAQTRSSYSYYKSLTVNDSINIIVDVNNLFCNYSDIDIWDIYLKSDNFFTTDSGGFFGFLNSILLKFKREKEIIRKLENLLEGFGSDIELSIFYQSLEDSISNSFFFAKKNTLKSKRVLVEDGLLNYLPERFKYLRVMSILLKKLVFNSMGITYRIPLTKWPNLTIDFLNSQDSNCNEIYVRYPDLSVHSGMKKVKKLKTSKISFDPIENTVLILGQEPLSLKQFLGDEYIMKFRELLDLISEKFKFETTKFYYKKHNLKEISNFDIKDFYGYRGIDFEIIESLDPIEEIIDQICPSNIVSFESSGLFNLKLDIESNPIVNFYGYPIYNKFVKDLFVQAGINILS